MKMFLFALISAMAVSAYSRDRDMEMPPQRPAIELNVKRGDDIIDFESCDFGGTVVKTKEFRVGKIFILNFAKDPTIKKQSENTTALNQISEKYKGKVTILEVVQCDELTREEVIEFYEWMKATYTIVLDFDGKIGEKYGVKKPPPIIIADASGKIHYVLPAYISPQVLGRILDTVIQQQEPHER